MNLDMYDLNLFQRALEELGIALESSQMNQFIK